MGVPRCKSQHELKFSKSDILFTGDGNPLMILSTEIHPFIDQAESLLDNSLIDV